MEQEEEEEKDEERAEDKGNAMRLIAGEVNTGIEVEWARRRRWRGGEGWENGEKNRAEDK